MAETQEKVRPLVAPPKEEVEETPAGAGSSVSSDEPKHKTKEVKFTSEVVEEVVASWPKDKNFTPAQIHDKVLESGYNLNTMERGAVQQKLIEMCKEGKVTRVVRGRYVRGGPKRLKDAKPRKTAAKKKAEKPSEPMTPAETPPPVEEDEITAEDLAAMMEPVGVADLNSAFDALITICRLQDTRNAEYWHNVGTMCTVFERIVEALNSDDG